jgi:hypothetical protein
VKSLTEWHERPRQVETRDGDVAHENLLQDIEPQPERSALVFIRDYQTADDFHEDPRC